ncbi:MAG: inorganic phosphate transporter [Candidatus Kapaibacteriales bacterium]
MDINLILLTVLVILAVIDLTVGVANDAVNFLNAAVGSKAAKLRTVLIIAAIGVLVGVLFSGGMMKIARSGIFDPSFFLMPELLIIFAAAMFQDIILLDTYNTLGLPTSTTVSVVFGLFGAGLGITLIKLSTDAIPGATFLDYMQMADVTKIVIAIFASVAIAFAVGFAIQFLTRLIFGFSYHERFKKFGAIWGSLALTSISLFIIMKGLKNADPELFGGGVIEYINNNLQEVSLYLLVGWGIILQIMISFTKINVLKIIVMAGTFALAMAFAANDLVNFIGAPIAALNTYDLAQGYTDPHNTLMGDLATKAQADKIYLMIAGLIMMLTLFLSKKARSVTATTIGLSSQDSGNEKFKSNAIGRFLVRSTLGITEILNTYIPDKSRLKTTYNKRFDTRGFLSNSIDSNEASNKTNISPKEKPAFDLVRAAVILMVSAGLISIATSLTLPLSTTYVTFIVAMAAALPDRAWGRDSAAYRVSGVIYVIGGWFVTALGAMVTAATIAILIYFGGLPAIIGLCILIVFVLITSSMRHKKQEKARQLTMASEELLSINPKNSTYQLRRNASRFILQTEAYYQDTIDSINDFNLGSARNLENVPYSLKSDLNKLTLESERLASANINLIEIQDKKKESHPEDFIESELEEHGIENHDFYYEVEGVNKTINYLGNILNSSINTYQTLSDCAEKVSMHIYNSHSQLSAQQTDSIYKLQKKISLHLKKISDIILNGNNSDYYSINENRKEIISEIYSLRQQSMVEKANQSSGNSRVRELYHYLLSLSQSILDSSNSIAKSILKFDNKVS